MNKMLIVTLLLLVFVTSMLAWQEHHDNIHDNVPRCFATSEANAIEEKDLHIPFAPAGELKRGSQQLMSGCHALFRVKMGK
jgi:hypothetical protein